MRVEDDDPAITQTVHEFVDKALAVQTARHLPPAPPALCRLRIAGWTTRRQAACSRDSVLVLVLVPWCQGVLVPVLVLVPWC